MAQTITEPNITSGNSSSSTHTHTHVVRIKSKPIGLEPLIALAVIVAIFGIWLTYKSYQHKKLHRQKKRKNSSKKRR